MTRSSSAESQFGIGMIHLTACDGVRSATTRFPLLVGETMTNDTILPPCAATGPLGNGSTTLTTKNLRLQQVYASALFPPVALVITELRFRRSRTQPAFETVVPDLEIRLSTSV